MATLTVWRFPSAEGAEQALATLESLQKQELIEVHDGATVTWPVDRKKPKTKQMHSLAGGGALGGSFWGLLFGLIFFVPLLGAAIGAAAGAVGSPISAVVRERRRGTSSDSISTRFIRSPGSTCPPSRWSYRCRIPTVTT